MSLDYVLGTIVVLIVIGVVVYGLSCLMTLHKLWKEEEDHEKNKE